MRKIDSLVPTTYAEAEKALNGRQYRTLSVNTFLERRFDGRIALRLHSTDVVTYNADGTLILASGGWHTTTTKARINAALCGSGLRIAQVKHVWQLVSTRREGIVCHFFDGMQVAAS